MAKKQEQPKCPNGHPANSNGNCFNKTCPYRNEERHKGGPQPT